jgi:hypothetical protein
VAVDEVQFCVCPDLGASVHEPFFGHWGPLVVAGVKREKGGPTWDIRIDLHVIVVGLFGAEVVSARGHREGAAPFARGLHPWKMEGGCM